MRFSSVNITAIKVSVTMEALHEIFCDAVINPTDVSGSMDFGPSRILRKYWGPESELQATYFGDGDIGRSVLSISEGLKALNLIHTAAVGKDGVLTKENLVTALKSSLSYSLERGNVILCLPDFDGFISPLLPEERAFITVSEIKDFILTNWPPMEEIIVWTDDPRMASIYKEILENTEKGTPDIDWLRAPLNAEIVYGSGVTKKHVIEKIILGCRDAEEVFNESQIERTPEIEKAISEVTSLYSPVYLRISQVTFQCSRAGKKQSCYGG